MCEPYHSISLQYSPGYGYNSETSEEQALTDTRRLEEFLVSQHQSIDFVETISLRDEAAQQFVPFKLFSQFGMGHSYSQQQHNENMGYVGQYTSFECDWGHRVTKVDGGYHVLKDHQLLALQAADIHARRHSTGNIYTFRDFLKMSLFRTRDRYSSYLHRMRDTMLNETGKAKLEVDIKNFFGCGLSDISKYDHVDWGKSEVEIAQFMVSLTERALVVSEWSDDDAAWIKEQTGMAALEV